VLQELPRLHTAGGGQNRNLPRRLARRRLQSHIDPGLKLHAKADLAIEGQSIAAILEPGTPVESKAVFDVSGLLVMAGFIDLHVHVFDGVTHYGVEPRVPRGVTTALDAGSSGALTFPGFRKFVLDDVASATRIIEANRDRIVGVKVRLSHFLAAGGKNELGALLRAREVAGTVGLPLMVHSPCSSSPIERILAELRPGDILTHCFHGHACGIVDPDLKVLPVVRQKLEEGLLLDVGQGRGSFTFDVARACLRQEVLPHTISSDLHHYNLHGPVFDLVTTINKFLSLGLELDEVVRRVTTIPAQILHSEGKIGTLRPGAFADVIVLEMQEGEFPLTDTHGITETSRHRLELPYIFRAGQEVKTFTRPESSEDYFSPEVLPALCKTDAFKC
jgi:dihydroorotase